MTIMRPSEAKSKSKYNFDECEKARTKEYRLFNINRFSELIKSDIDNNDLHYDENERHIILFETKYGEKIGIAYPGKESIKKKNQFPWDMRPILYTSNSKLLKNQNFFDLYNIIEKIYKKNIDLYYCILSIFFKMGYMINVKLENISYYDYKNSLFTGELKFYNFDFHTDLIEYLDSQLEIFESKDMEGNTVKISLISYLMYYYLLFQQEDNKYYFRNNEKLNQNQGRTSTALSSILFGGVLTNKTSISDALQKFISGKGIGKCKLEDLSKMTNKMICYTNYKKEILNICKEKGIKCVRNSTITIDEIKIKGLKIIPLNTLIISNDDYNKFHKQLKKRGWQNVFSLDNKKKYETLLKKIKKESC